MRCVLAALVLLLGVTGAEASLATHNAVERKVVAAAKRMSAKDCKPRDVGQLKLTGCGYGAFFSKGQWSVVVTAGYIGPHGQHMHGGAVGIYYFTSSGTFIKVVPGM